MSRKHNHTNCLVLNADYTPLAVITWKRAMIWSIKYENNEKYGVDIIDFYKNDYIMGVNRKFPIPAVCKTKRFFKITNQQLTFSRKNIYIRDNHTCQYCGIQQEIKNLTYDHVIPKSKWDYDKGSPTTWTNIVTACSSCNKKKGNRTPKQANMIPKHHPVEPNKNIKYLPVSTHLDNIKENIPEEWELYLPASYYL